MSGARFFTLPGERVLKNHGFRAILNREFFPGWNGEGIVETNTECSMTNGTKPGRWSLRLLAMVLLLGLFPAINLLVDPFGVFGEYLGPALPLVWIQ